MASALIAMSTSLQEREYDCSGLASMTDVEAADAIKAFVAEQDAARPFGIAWPAHKKLESELKYFGFAHVTMSKLESHQVYIVRGQSVNSTCRSVEDLRRIFKKLGRDIGFAFRAADTALSFARGRFQVALVLPDGSTAPEILFGPDEDNEADQI